MERRFCVNKKSRTRVKGRTVFFVFLLMAAVLFAVQAMAFTVDFLGKKMGVNGYINQGVQFGVAGGHYDTISGFQGALMQALLEVDYHPADNVKLFVSGKLIKDWAYNILANDDHWQDRGFDKSRSELSILSAYEDYLSEAHLTWTPGNFNFRVGKQIVSWSRMDFVRIMDQINPRDTRRGFADVEFESTIIPIWLVKTEYYPERFPGFLNDLAYEFTFNPNADFIGDKALSTGNYEHGIWAADALVPLGAVTGRAGALLEDIEKPDSWDSDGFEYAFRIKGTLRDSTFFTLNYFNGVDNTPVSLYDPTRTGNPVEVMPGFFMPVPGLNGLSDRDDRGRQIIETYMKGKYPDKKYAGFTLARDFESLYLDWLGGVAPLLRFEAIYEFDTTFSTSGRPAGNRFEKHDAIYYGVSGDWKFKCDLLNPRRYFSLMPVFAHRHIKHYPDNYTLNVKDENTYTLAGIFSTKYIHDKLTPTIIYSRTLSNEKSDLWILKLAYSPNETWTYKAQLFLLEKKGFEAVDHKDNVSFTVQYQF